jgi:molecular chaperone GrpE (heat shock protein)
MSGTEAEAIVVVAEIGPAAPSTSSNGTGGNAAMLADISKPADVEQLGDAIKRLKAEQDAVRADRKRVTKELKNAQKRKQRLKKRAKQLSNEDLVSVLQLRAAEKPAGSATPP